MPPGYLQQEFTSFCVACFRDLSEQQYVDLRRTFFGGAASMFGVLMSEIGPEDGSIQAGEALMKKLQKELRDFYEAVKRGEA